ncbi:YcbK family protein [Falsiroseomonas sp. HW251]|uniref:YcbK family protein n=1 Tax=Falsiroseomonas sp. HW251 TaxID=3390998 RepID=UPI003D31B7FF
MTLGRRKLLGAGGALLAPVAARAEGERFIWTRNGAGEEVATAYRSGQDYDGAALGRLRHLLRDIGQRMEGPLPPLLIDIMSVLQEQWGYSRPLLVRSGYRTPQTNASIEGAAPASLHLRGLAVDVSVPGMPIGQVGLAAWTLQRRLGFMGIGLYRDFVHIDIGPQRTWTRFG